MSSPRIAFVGSPTMVSPWLLQSLTRVATLEAICGDDAETQSRRHHARWAFHDLESMLKESEPEGVIIAAPPAERLKLIKQCLAAGAGVMLIGMPGPASNCPRLATMAKLSGRFVMASSALRYAPAILLAKRLIDSGQFGTPISVALSSTRRGSAREALSDDGPIEADQIFEALDVLHATLGPIKQAYATTHPDGAMAVCGIVGADVPLSIVFHASGASESVGLSMEIRASDGTSLTFDRGCQLICANGTKLAAAHRPNLSAADPAVELGYAGLAAEFRRQLESGRNAGGLVGPVTTVAAGAEAILTSAAKGRPMQPKPVTAKSKKQRGEKATAGGLV